MTKEEFLSGVIFKSGHKRGGFRFVNTESAVSMGYLEEKNYMAQWVHYGNISKIDATGANIYFMGFRKVHKERIHFSELEIMGDIKPKA